MRSIGLILSLSGFPVIAQGWDNLAIAQVAGPAIVAQQVDEIDRALREGDRLFQEGSKESLVAAIKEFEKVLNSTRSTPFSIRKALSLLALGHINDLLGQKRKALEYYEQSLPIYRAAGDTIGEAATLNNIGLVYDTLGEKHKALSFYNRALTSLHSANTTEKRQEAKVLNNIGLLYSDLGEREISLEFHYRTLTLWKSIADEKGEATTLNNIGIVYSGLGNKEKALKFYIQSLPLRRKAKDKNGEAATLNNMGLIYASSDRNQTALQFYTESLLIRQKIGDKLGEANTLNNIGVLFTDINKKQQARIFFDKALALNRLLEDKSGESATLNNIGNLYDVLGERQKALEFSSRALSLSSIVGERESEALFLRNIGYMFIKQKRMATAIAFYKQSINVYETLRADISSLTRIEQSLYTQTISHAYRDLADFLTQQGHLAEAHQVIELLKIRELKELEPNKAESKRSIQQLPMSESEKQEISKINPEVAKDIQAQSLPTRGDRLSQNPLNQSAQALLNNQPNSALIYQLFTQDKLWIILVTPDGKLQRFASSANKIKLESLIAAFRQQIEQCEKVNYICDKTDTQTLNQTSQQLYQQLFPTELQTALKAANPGHLTFALDGTLRNIPIAALHTGTQYLTEQYTLSTIIAAQLTDSQDKLPTDPAQTPILAVGTSKSATIPVPNYIAIDRQDRYRGLSNVPVELDAIVSPNKSPGTFPGLQLLDDQFTLSNLQKQLPQHRILHIASHGIFRPNFLDYSYILLGNNQPWSIAQMDSNSDRKLFQNIHMVSLSTCQSGLGGRDTNGMEIAGMSHAFLSQGAKTVTASLWQVDDASTAMFMQHFYQTLAQKPNPSKAASLHQAQLHLLRTPRSALIEQLKRSTRFRLIDSPTSRPVQKTADYTHPYYWAAFTLIGNSR